MISIRPSGDVQPFVKQLRLLGREPRKILVSSANRTARRTKTRVSSAVREEVPLKKKEVDRRIKIKYAVSRSGGFDTQAEVNLLPGAAMLFRQRGRPLRPDSQKGKPVKRRRAGATAVYLKSKGRETFAKSFVLRLKTGHLGIFRRVPGSFTRTGKQEIRELWGPRFADSITPDREREIEREASEFFIKNVEGQTQRALDRAVRR